MNKMKRRNFLKLFPFAGLAAVFGSEPDIVAKKRIQNKRVMPPAPIIKIDGEYYKGFSGLNSRINKE